MAISTGVKFGAAATLSAGAPAATYFAWDYIVLYSVERKVIKEDVTFVIDEKENSEDKKSWTIKVKTENNGEWKESGGYYWECVVSGPSTLAIEKLDLEIRLAKSSGNTYDIRGKLVNECAKNRIIKESKRVATKFSFPETATIDNWFKYLFGSDILNETEKKVLSDSVYFSINSQNTDGKNSLWTITAQPKSGTSDWTTGTDVWVCKISGPLNLSIDQAKWSEKLPTSSSVESTDTMKKINKKKLVYACAKDRQINKNTTVMSNFVFPETTTSDNWTTYLFGSPSSSV